MEKPAFTDEQRAYFRAAAGRRQRVTGVCAVCGQPYEGLAWRQFCSARCRTRETSRRYRERQRAQRTAGAALDTPQAAPEPAP
jgi:endogenous inhibitor of DNA gyrase (YacG/DUF329 family)